MKIHIVLVSDQVLANLIPILMEKPDLVLLVVTAGMAARRLDRHLQALLEERGIQARICPNAPDVDVRAIQAYANALIAPVVEAYAEPEVVLNATGGTKLMSLAFVEVCRGLVSRILYTDTAHRRIEYLPNGNASLPAPTAMTNTLDLPGYLGAQGFRYRQAASDDPDWRATVQRRKAACKYLGQHMGEPHLQHYVGEMNYRANQALGPVPGTREEELSEPRQAFDSPPRGIWARAQAELVKAGLIAWEAGEPAFIFANAEAARFIRGGWLEEYAWHILSDAQAFDVRLGVEGLWRDTKKTTNEFDVLACQINQLLVIECKTLQYRTENENEIAYKLDSLSQDVRGLFGDTWLLSARKPSDVLTERVRRARIRLIGPEELANLREIVLAWLAGHRH
jgi:hypothetical protein